MVAVQFGDVGRMRMSRARVLVLCTGNSCRSQMAEGALRHLAGDRDVEVESAGTEPKPVHPLAVRVMQEIGIDISGQRSKGIGQLDRSRPFTHVITVCSEADARCPATMFSGAERLHWPFDDPAAFVGSEAETLEIFRRVRDEIVSRIRQWLASDPF